MIEVLSGRVFVVEDDQDTLELIECVLAKGGHELVGSVFWRAAALNEIPNLGPLGVNIVTLDQDIFGGDIVKAGFVEELKKTHPNIKTIGLSCSPMTVPVDVDLGKCNLGKLSKVVTSLLNVVDSDW